CSVRHDLPESIVGPLNLILEELVANVMEHGKTPEGGVVPIPIHIEMDVTDAFVELRVADASAPFDPRDRDDPDLSGDLEDRPIGGLGLYFVREMSDSLEYEYKNGWNVFRLRKALSQGKPA